MKTRVTVLVDNISSSPAIASEHGFSAYIEHKGVKILCDMGASDMFIHNAQVLGIDLSDLSYSVVSHAHNDHCGGMRYLLEQYSTNIYISEKCINRRFFSSRHNTKREIGVDNTLFISHKERFYFVEDSCWLSADIALVKCTHNHYPRPYGNSFLTIIDGEQEKIDDFSHELALVLRDERGLIIISPCSHCGIMNIIASCKEFTSVDTITHFIGGLHLVDSTESERETLVLCDSIKRVCPETKIITGHCTGLLSKEILSTKLSSNQISLFSGGEEYKW